MTKKIFFHSFLLGAVVLLLCTSLFFGLRYRETLNETYKTMKVEADYAAAGLALKGTEYLEDIKGANRITWIASDGNVLYDSDHPDLAHNQGDCAEVRAALAEGEGRGIRKSESGKEKTIYYALRCDDNTVLRLSRPLSRFQAAFHSVSPVLWVLILVFLIQSFESVVLWGKTAFGSSVDNHQNFSLNSTSNKGKYNFKSRITKRNRHCTY